MRLPRFRNLVNMPLFSINFSNWHLVVNMVTSQTRSLVVSRHYLAVRNGRKVWELVSPKTNGRNPVTDLHFMWDSESGLVSAHLPALYLGQAKLDHQDDLARRAENWQRLVLSVEKAEAEYRMLRDELEALKKQQTPSTASPIFAQERDLKKTLPTYQSVGEESDPPANPYDMVDTDGSETPRGAFALREPELLRARLDPRPGEVNLRETLPAPAPCASGPLESRPVPPSAWQSR